MEGGCCGARWWRHGNVQDRLRGGLYVGVNTGELKVCECISMIEEVVCGKMDLF